MSAIIKDNFIDPGSPIHNPPYKRPVNFVARFPTVMVPAEVRNTSLLAELIPKPLESIGNLIFVIVVNSTELHGDGQQNVTRQMEITAPVTYKNRYFTFYFEVLSSSFGGIIPARELFSMPTVPGHVDISIKDNCWKVTSAYYNNDKECCSLTYKSIRPGNASDLGAVPKVLTLRNVVSTVQGEPRLSVKLVTPRVVNQKMSNLRIGEGTFQFCEGAPSYLRDLDVGPVNTIPCVAADMVLDIQWDGLRIVHDYGTQDQAQG